MNTTYFKAKIGEREYIEQLQRDGIVYCNTLKYFTKVEDGQIRGDSHENAFDFKTYDKPRLQIKPANDPNAVFKDVNVTWAQMVTRNPEPYGNLYCLYCVDMTNAGSEGQISVDEKNKEFGSHVLVLLNSEMFEEKLYNELKNRNLEYHFGHVNYLDLKKHSGRKTLFQKDIKYSFQNEFRIFIENPTQDTLILKLGDLSDISVIYEFDVFKQLYYKRP